MKTDKMTIREIITMIRDYIQQKCETDTGFKAAYLIGSMNQMELDDVFPSFRDIDVGVITDSVDDLHNEEELVNGYIVETVRSNPRFYADAEALLRDARYADNIAFGTILLDPAHFMEPLSAKVRAEFKRRKWVRARWENEYRQAFQNLEQMKQANSAGAFMMNYGRFVMLMTGSLTVCHLLPPTHRRGPVQLRDALLKAGDAPLYNDYLKMAGVQNITPQDAENLLDDAVSMFDLAIKVFKTPIPYAYKLEPFIRPYLLEGTRDIFKDHGYQESIFWIARFYVIAAMVIINDGSAEQKQMAGQKLTAFMQALNIDTVEARKKRAACCETFLGTMRAYAENMTMHSPLYDD
ncbi:MAG: hypothetical protein EOL87_17620 [Spartobacteria bacterium]|nr:hypothetical protein [Spartobacteria bacterium]